MEAVMKTKVCVTFSETKGKYLNLHVLIVCTYSKITNKYVTDIIMENKCIT